MDVELSRIELLRDGITNELLLHRIGILRFSGGGGTKHKQPWQALF